MCHYNINFEKAVARLRERYILTDITFKGRVYRAEECFSLGFITLGHVCYSTAVIMLRTGLPLSEIEAIVDSFLLVLAKRNNIDLTGRELT